MSARELSSERDFHARVSVCACVCVCRYSSEENVEIVPRNDGTYAVNYSVRQPGDYTLTMKYGGQPIKDGFYKFTVTQW